MMRKSDMKRQTFRIPPDIWREIEIKLLTNKHEGREPSTWQSLIEILLDKWLAEEGEVK